MASNQGDIGSAPIGAGTDRQRMTEQIKKYVARDNQQSDNEGAREENNPAGPSNLEKMKAKQEETISHKDHCPSILQQELENGNKEVPDGTVCLRVAEVSWIATIALHSDKDDKGEWKVKLTCGSDYPLTKPSGEILEPLRKRQKLEDMNLPSMENWNNGKKMADILYNIKEVMKGEDESS